MKNLNLTFLLLIFSVFNFQSAKAQTITGSGPIVTEAINMKDLSSIGLSIPAQVFIQQGTNQKIEIKGQKNIIDLVNKEPKGDSWNIEFPKGSKIKNHESLEIYITLKTLESLSIGGSGTITGKGKFSNINKLELSIGGSGDISLDVDAEKVACSIGGSGNIALKGTSDEIKISLGGSGDVDAIGLKVNKCEVSSAGSGTASVDVSEYLDVSLAGSGDVKYTGSPKVKSSIVGSGDVLPY